MSEILWFHVRTNIEKRFPRVNIHLDIAGAASETSIMRGVVIENVSKVFSGNATDVHALRDVSLSVHPGEVLTLMGPSGAGKTTLLRLIAGLETPTHGDILIADHCVTNIPPHARDVAMVFQSAALYPHLTVLENLTLGLKLRRLSRTEIGKRVDAVVEMIGLAGLLDRRPASLSGGQAQRVALARALVRQPKVLLLDEPCSNLDAPARRQMRHELHTMQRRLSLTMIYVTHDRAEAMALGDRVAILDGGALEQVGTPCELEQKPATARVAEFLRSSPCD